MSEPQLITPEIKNGPEREIICKLLNEEEKAHSDGLFVIAGNESFTEILLMLNNARMRFLEVCALSKQFKAPEIAEIKFQRYNTYFRVCNMVKRMVNGDLDNI